MKKQGKQLIILLVIVAVIAGGYFGLRAWNSSQEEAEAQASADAVVYLSTLEDISEISFSYEGETMDFVKTDNVWTYAEDGDFPLDTSYLTALETSLKSLTALRSFENVEGDAAYGLEDPALWVTAKTTGGDEVRIDIGDATGSNYYARLADDDLIYAIASTLVTKLSYSLMDLAEPETLPTLTEADIETVTLESASGTLNLRKTAEVTQENVLTDTGEVDDDGNAIYETTTEDVTTYIWEKETDSGWVTLPEDGTTLSDLVSELTGLAFAACYDYKATDEDLAACGLAEPAYCLTITYSAGEMTLLIGNAVDSAYYAMLAGSSQIDTLAYTKTITLLSEGLSDNLES